jgi:hypothetical protein
VTDEVVAKYAVIRAAVNLPDGFLPPNLEGRWYDLADILEAREPQIEGAVAVATSRFERRDDGATARVYEVRP